MEKSETLFKEPAADRGPKKDLRGRFCSKPFRHMELHKEFSTYLCCPSWLPQPLGSCEQVGLPAIWNSEIAQKIRASILDGSFSYCDHQVCPSIQGDSLPKIEDLTEDLKEIVRAQQVVLPTPPQEIDLSYDRSCNLACPSCRPQKIHLTSGEELDRQRRFSDQLVVDIESHASRSQGEIKLFITGSGDPFASKVYREILFRLSSERTPNLRIILHTNGVLLTQAMWERLAPIHHAISGLSISIDAAKEQTYQQVRKHGNWQQLNENLHFLASLSKRHRHQWLSCNFVVQTANYREMGDFVRFCKSFNGIGHVFFSLIQDWGTWSKEQYEEQCIWKESHPGFNDFLQALRDPVLCEPEVFLGNLSEYRKRALIQQPFQEASVHV